MLTAGQMDGTPEKRHGIADVSGIILRSLLHQQHFPLFD
jgi:hypothetical protein